ncbi:EamA family transporter [Candidimonas humi]|uniref:DMT family transporter n=1 Tax=Candidimonas humi TaxID=683355 RepID=A0ABV8NT86_9BURK|nr:EamA family transporter [Candidimonas humi]MBV6303721.1 EamA family transporter [Candidimonas humi]
MQALPQERVAKRAAERLPPHTFFLISAVFHYLGPALAVLLFAHVAVLGVTWLRIVSAAVIFALWRRPWLIFRRLDRATRRTLILFGVVLAAMNTLFYLAIDRLPLATVGAIEFLGPIALAAYGIRTRRNAAALLVTVLGMVALTEFQLAGAPLGFACAFGNCGLFVLYVVLGHRVANADGEAAGQETSSIERLGAAMLIAAIVVTPVGLKGALPAFTDPVLLLAGMGVGLCSSVIPYVCDQLAMARLPRASFALMLALLPVFALMIGAVVLRQIPNLRELMGVSLVVVGIAIHQRQ